VPVRPDSLAHRRAPNSLHGAARRACAYRTTEMLLF
jgi:hypothetical protein